MKNQTINDTEEISDMNTLSFEGNSQGFDNSTSPSSFIGMREGEGL